MTPRDIGTTLYQLEQLMYGYNYEVKFGIDFFDHCTNLEAFKAALKKAYPNSQPDEITLVPMSLDDFWEEINFGLDYRGDTWAGLSLNQEREEKLKQRQKEYKEYISSFINHNTTIYNYPDEKGIPGYPVFWDYRFVLLSEGKCLFIYGSASD